MRHGSLFSGMGGLDLGVNAVFNSTTAWVSDIDKGARKALDHRFGDVPNLSDITTVDWSAVEPVDIVSGGFPCTDISHAGKRAGLAPGTRSGLWSEMQRCVAALRPRLVIIENVRGLLSAKAHSDMELCSWCVGDDQEVVALRAFGAVLGDLAELGFDARWHGLRAADIGAPHGRFRVFVVAYPANLGYERLRFARRGRTGPADGNSEPVALLPTPESSDGSGGRVSAEAGGFRKSGAKRAVTLATAVHHLLPTPRATDGTKGGPNQRGSSGDLMLPSAVKLLPTPMAADAAASGGDPTTANVTVRGRRDWGIYAAAIERWERVFGKPAPAPTEPGRNGALHLSPKFVEWMLGLPAGWVTDVPSVTRNEALKALGNGCVPQQAAAALRFLLDAQEAPA